MYWVMTADIPQLVDYDTLGFGQHAMGLLTE